MARPGPRATLARVVAPPSLTSAALPRPTSTQVREPTAAVFSAECMLRGMGVPLEWSMARRPQDGGGCGGGGYVDVEAGVRESGAGDALMRDDASHDALWDALAGLPPGEALPEGLPGRFYFEARSYVRSAQYADRLEEWARHLPAEK